MYAELNKEREMICIAKFICFLGVIVSHCVIYGRSDVNELFFWGKNFWLLKTATSLNVCLIYLAFFSFANQNRLFEAEYRLTNSDIATKYSIMLISLENVISLLSYNHYESLITGLPLTSIAFNFLFIVFFWKKNRYLVFFASFLIYCLNSGLLLSSIHEFESVIARWPNRMLVLIGAMQFCLYFLFVIFVVGRVLPFRGKGLRNILMLFSLIVLYKFSSQKMAAFYFFIPRIFWGSRNSPVLYPSLVWNTVFVSSFAMYFIFEINFMKKLKKKKIMLFFSILVYISYLHWIDFFNMFKFNHEQKSLSWDLYKFSQVTLRDCFFQMLSLFSLLVFSYQLRFVLYKLRRVGNIVRFFSDSVLYIYLGIVCFGNVSSRIWPTSFSLHFQFLLQLTFYFILSVIIAYVHKWLINTKIKFKLLKRNSIAIFNQG